MRRAIQKHLRDVLAIAAIAVVAILVGGYILSNQRFYAPAWVPLIGSDFVDYQAQMETAQAFTAGQGQTVMIAGVNVGEIGKVTLKDGRALITMKMQHKYTPIYKDATILSRPKTGLNDMTLELDPGNKSAGELPAGGTVPISQTLPNVNPDQFLAGLDIETRNYLQLLIGGAAQGLDGNAANLSATLKRFDPLARHTTKITRLLVKRQRYIKRAIHNFRLLASALGAKDTQLAEFVDSSNEVFKAFANTENGLRETIRELPAALVATNNAATKSQELTSVLGPTLASLQPTAKGLAPALQAFQSFAKETDAGHRESARPVHRDRAATGCRAAPGRGRPRSDAAQAGGVVRRPQRPLQRARVQPARQAGGLPLLAVVGQPHGRRRCSARRTATG